MFIKLKAIAATAAVAGVVALAGASEASAVRIGTLSTPTGSGSMSFSATAPSSRLVAPSGIALNCTTTSANTTINTGLFGTSFPVTVGTVQPFFGVGGSCTSVNFTFTVNCTSGSNLQVTGAPVGGVTPGRIVGISCLITANLGCTAKVVGSVPASYQNPTAAAAGRLTVATSGQSLSVTSSTCGALLPNGAATFGGTGAGGGGIVNLAYTLNGPSSGHPFIST